jgi:hypothetical protein
MAIAGLRRRPVSIVIAWHKGERITAGAFAKSRPTTSRARFATRQARYAQHYTVAECLGVFATHWRQEKSVVSRPRMAAQAGGVLHTCAEKHEASATESEPSVNGYEINERHQHHQHRSPRRRRSDKANGVRGLRDARCPLPHSFDDSRVSDRMFRRNEEMRRYTNRRMACHRAPALRFGISRQAAVAGAAFRHPQSQATSTRASCSRRRDDTTCL